MKNAIVLVLISLFFSCKSEHKNKKAIGAIFGTRYSVIYDSDVNYKNQFDSLFYVINKSMSTYQINSDISKLNRNESFEIDEHFEKVYDISKKIFKETKGAFDPTIGNVVNAWKFGAEDIIEVIDRTKIDSLMQYVGFGKTNKHKNRIKKTNPNVYLEFNAIAKGYSVDVIAEFLDGKKIKNYLVEIGGEIRTKGKNVEKQKGWKVGVEAPHFDGEKSILKVVTLQNKAMATSGTYRKFKIDKNGNRYAHIIDTKTGYPSKTNILSVSVIAENCITADAYATAFKAMGIEKIKIFLKEHPELKVFLIFENSKNKIETLSLNGVN